MKLEDVRVRFNQDFPVPKMELRGSMLAPPMTDHHALVGTAFDYLLRFYLERLNSNATAWRWVAEHSVELLRRTRGGHLLGRAIVRGAKEAKAEYVRTGEVSDRLLESAILLAQLDGVYRVGLIDPNLGVVDHHDIDDLRNILSFVKPDLFKAKEACILNPVFAESRLVGGADADFIIDDTLFEIKTTKYLGLRAEYYHQLVGYYALYSLGGLSFDPRVRINISKLAIYYSRHGFVQEIDVSTLLGATDFGAFLIWFQARAKRTYPPEDFPER